FTFFPYTTLFRSLILDIPGELNASLIHVCRLVVELELILILQFDYDLFNIFVANTIKPFGLISRNSEQTGSQHIARLEHSSTKTRSTKETQREIELLYTKSTNCSDS